MPHIKPLIHLLRLHAPVGTLLLLWPALWSMALASLHRDYPFYLSLLFLVGAFAMRSLGCIINDYMDRKIDAKVARTKNRPLACGSISLPVAGGIALLLALLGLGVLTQLNTPTILLGLAVVPLIIAYPLMKRFTYWPQLFLGITFNWGALLGWMAVSGHLALPSLLLYIACVFWTLGYDTIYAFQDRTDDIASGVKSSAIRVQHSPKRWLGCFYLLFWLGLMATGLVASLSWHYYLGLLGVAAHLAWQVYSLDINHFEGCGKIFRSNQWLGIVVFTSIIC